MNQADLFQVSESRYTKPTQSEKDSFLDRYQVVLRIDHTVIMCIFLLVLLTVVYAYGFERGQNAAFSAQKQQEISPLQQAENQILSKDTQDDVIVVDTSVIGNPKSVTEKVKVGEFKIQEEVLKKDEPILPIVKKEEQASQAGQELMKKMSGKYTIQIVTYKTEEAAKQQIEKLSTKGYEGFVIPSGSYLQVCVNSFKDRQSAKSVLKALQSKKLAPVDAYIRAMPA